MPFNFADQGGLGKLGDTTQKGLENFVMPGEEARTASKLALQMMNAKMESEYGKSSALSAQSAQQVGEQSVLTTQLGKVPESQARKLLAPFGVDLPDGIGDVPHETMDSMLKAGAMKQMLGSKTEVSQKPVYDPSTGILIGHQRVNANGFNMGAPESMPGASDSLVKAHSILAAQQQLQYIDDNMSQYPQGRIGGMISGAEGAMGLNPKIKQLRNAQQALAVGLPSAVEGVQRLNPQEFSVFNDIMSKPWSTQDEAKNSTQMLHQMLDTRASILGIGTAPGWQPPWKQAQAHYEQGVQAGTNGQSQPQVTSFAQRLANAKALQAANAKQAATPSPTAQ